MWVVLLFYPMASVDELATRYWSKRMSGIEEIGSFVVTIVMSNRGAYLGVISLPSKASYRLRDG